MPTAETVSVVIPCYNGAAYLREAIDSVLRQTVAPLELLVINDGSTDDSAEVAGSYGPPVRVVSQENRGLAATRNRGLDEARGDWVAFLDADDVWEPNKLEMQLAALEPDVVACHTNYYNFGTTNNRNEESLAPPGVDPYTPVNILTNSPFNMSALMVRRALPVRTRPSDRNAEDMMYCTELARAGRIVYVDSHLTGYRRHGDSLTSHTAFSFIWHETVLRWVSANPLGLTPEELDAIRDGLLTKLIDLARTAKWRRDWNTYRAVRDYLTMFRDSPRVANFLRQRPWPRWVYTLGDRLVRGHTGRVTVTTEKGVSR